MPQLDPRGRACADPPSPAIMQGGFRGPLSKTTGAFHGSCSSYTPKNEEVDPAFWTTAPQFPHPFLHCSVHTSDQIPKLQEGLTMEPASGTMMEVDSQAVWPSEGPSPRHTRAPSLVGSAEHGKASLREESPVCSRVLSQHQLWRMSMTRCPHFLF